MTRVIPDMSVKPEVALLEDVLTEIAEGRLRVPRFQRPFVWRPDQMLELFDSIERGYPIGSLLVWDTKDDLGSLDAVAGISLPPPPTENRSVSYILDGHQRLSTLFGVLMRAGSAPRSVHQSDWMWWVYRELGQDEGYGLRFRHIRNGGEPPPTYLPMRAVLRTMDFLAYARELGDQVSREEMDYLIDEAEQVAQRIKSYRVAVVRLVGGSLTQAVEVFSRLNSSGVSMTPDLMVSALTYVEGESLADQMDAIRETLASDGFAGVDSMSVFRSILAVLGEEDILQARWDTLARRLEGRLEDAVSVAEVSLQLGAAFLRDRVGVPSARLLPYSIQLVLLAAFFAEKPIPTDEDLAELERWFWATSWSGYFAGANTTQVKASLQEMKLFASGRGKLVSPEPARPFPDRFDMRGARVRTLLVWFLREFPAPLDLRGDPIDPIDLLAAADTGAFRHVVPSSVPNGSSPANRLMFPTPRGVSVKRALTDLRGDIRHRVAASHCIPLEAIDALGAGGDSDFIALRADAMAAKERAFMEAAGVVPPPVLVGETDIDSV